MDRRKKENLAWIAISAIREEEKRCGQLLFTPQLVETTVNLMMNTVRFAQKPKKSSGRA
ncbi:MAG: hypothetical protein AAF587_28120 [Bacteroidota bacterium]